MARFTFTLLSDWYSSELNGLASRWLAPLGSLPQIPSPIGQPAYLSDFILPRGLRIPPINIVLTTFDQDAVIRNLSDLSNDFENMGEFTLVASNGVSVSFRGPNFPDHSRTDSASPYQFYPVDSIYNLILSFATTVHGLTDKSVTVLLWDGTNSHPVVTAAAADSIIGANTSVQLTGTATDPDPPPDTLSLQWTATPDIGTFSNPNSLSTVWTAPGPTDNDRPVTLTLTATEPDENLTGSASVTVTVRGNQPPIVTAEADQTTVDVGDTVNLTATATDPEGESMTYSWTSDIGGAFGSPTVLTTTWVAPAVSESTVVSLTFTASDGVRTRSATVTVIVRAPATQPLELPAVANKSTATGTVVNELLPAASEGLTPYIYSATGLPTGLGFRNRRVQGIPVLPGAYNISYVVTDSNQDMVTRTFVWTITGDAIPQPTGLNMRIDWGAQFYANPHSNVTGRIVSDIEFERGRNTASAILGRSQAGILRCDLQNSDGLFDEENPNSALAGLIRPGLQVQLRNGVTPLWTGVLDSIPTQFAQNGQHRARLTAFGVLSNAIEPEVSGGSLTAESAAQAFIELCAKGDLPYESPQPMPGDAYVMRRWWLIGRLRESLNAVEDTEGGLIFEDREGELGFHLRNYRPNENC